MISARYLFSSRQNKFQPLTNTTFELYKTQKSTLENIFIYTELGDGFKSSTLDLKLRNKLEV